MAILINRKSTILVGLFLTLEAIVPLSCWTVTFQHPCCWRSRNQHHHRHPALRSFLQAVRNETPKRWFGNCQHNKAQLHQKQQQRQELVTGQESMMCLNWKNIPKSKKIAFNLTANGVTRVFEKKRGESVQHVLMKGILWKLYMNDYPDLKIESSVDEDDVYTPDVVAATQQQQQQQVQDSAATHKNNNNNNDNNNNSTIGSVQFWGEAGRMSISKALSLVEQYPDSHLVQMRWAKPLHEFAPLVVEHFQNNLSLSLQQDRRGKFEFGAFSENDLWRLVHANGTIVACREDFEWLEW